MKARLAAALATALVAAGFAALGLIVLAYKIAASAGDARRRCGVAGRGPAAS